PQDDPRPVAAMLLEDVLPPPRQPRVDVARAQPTGAALERGEDLLVAEAVPRRGVGVLRRHGDVLHLPGVFVRASASLALCHGHLRSSAARRRCRAVTGEFAVRNIFVLAPCSPASPMNAAEARPRATGASRRRSAN